jgi:hypothetical protein
MCAIHPTRQYIPREASVTTLHVCSALLLILCAMSVDVFAGKPGEIVFSKVLIDPAHPASLGTEFKSGDHLYAVAFLEKSIADNLGSGTKKAEVEVFLYELKPPEYSYQQASEVQLESNTMWVSGEPLQKTFLPLDIVPGTGAMTAYGSQDLVYKKFGNEFYGPVQFANALSQLGPGDHTIVIKVSCNYNVVSEGKFVIKGNDYAVYKKMSAELNAAASGASTKSAMMPKSARSDKPLESEMITALKASQTYKDRIKGEVLRVVIIDPDWTVRRHEISGVILHRYIRATIAVKNSDGTCTVWQLVTFQQDYEGNKFQKTRFDGVGDPYTIPCENVMK